jgi:GDP-L-fucose synthase
VFLAAAKVGGIQANNTHRADFIYQNLAIQTNVLHTAWRNGVQKLLFLGSSCIYPRDCPQPMREEYLLTGPLEHTNEPYALAKIAGVKMCENYNSQYGTAFIPVMPTNLYGIGDNFDLEKSHVLPALIRKFHEAKISNNPSVTVWGSGKPQREFLYSDDLADACLFLMRQTKIPALTNIGSGNEVTIRQLAETIREIVQFQGDIVFDPSKPDGTLRKLLDSSRINELGWKPTIELRDGIKRVYEWFQQQV